MNYQTRRNHLLRRFREQLAEPVADLLAIAYEPRVDNEAYETQFNELVAAKQAELHETTQGLTTHDGGRIELLAKGIANQIFVAAEKDGLVMAADQLRAALERCTQIRKPDRPREQTRAVKLADVERVIGRSGKPIGLWR